MTDDIYDPDCSEDIYLARLRAMIDIVAAHLATTRMETAQLSQLVREIYGTISRMDPLWLSETSELRPSFDGAQKDIYPTDPPRAKPMEVLDARSDATSPALISAVPIHQSVHPDYIICLEDGKRLKTLKNI
ncbi:MAG: MucR family transcriptional regulator [Acetobacteraceae bacterium]